MSAAKEYQRLLESKGLSLREHGVRDIALERADALLAVELLRKASIPILGGDVYFKRESGIELAYANWHSDPMPGEDRDRFVNRSGLETENYIKSFPSSDAPALFALVIDG
jgi:hypothetical protein